MHDFGLAFLILACAAFGAGAVRGFAGFGDALFFLPLSGIVLSPIETIMVFVLIAVFGPLPQIPEAARTADRKIMIPLGINTAIFTPLGFMILSFLDPNIFRTVLSIMAIGVVLLMVSGFSPKFVLTPKASAALGAVCGFVGGFTGVPGTFLIFVLLNSGLRPAQTRALATITLLIYDSVMLISGAVHGDLNFNLLKIAALLLPIYFIASWLGRKVFDPEREKFFRAVALGLILTSGLLGLPILSA